MLLQFLESCTDQDQIQCASNAQNNEALKYLQNEIRKVFDVLFLNKSFMWFKSAICVSWEGFQVEMGKYRLLINDIVFGVRQVWV